ncbi:hypothetical protein MMC34_002118 [Xylographa carneopallida]|nr:hypothetical protein [Xylographa carneopallida]
MFEALRSQLNALLQPYSWARELAGILPLSALIDFIDIPQKLHIFQLAGAVPLWSWPITPAGSRLLLSDAYLQHSCCLDRYGCSPSWIAWDGFYGDEYFVSSPETVRLCLSSQRPRKIHNEDENMKQPDLRSQNLEIVHVSRLASQTHHRRPAESWTHHLFLDPWWMYSSTYLTISASGWVMISCIITMSAILQCYISLSFLVVTILTGVVVFSIYGRRPRRLLVRDVSRYNRLIVVAEHMNATDWIVFYGESTIVNSLLNRPLKPNGPSMSPAAGRYLRMILSILIIGQWALVVAAASTQDWNAYFISFWIATCIFLHSYVIPPKSEASDWMQSCAHIGLKRYQAQLSSRRALLNTIVALNPDSFPSPGEIGPEDRTRFSEEGLKWVDPILKPGPSRDKWEEATRIAMNEALRTGAKFPSVVWDQVYGGEYWRNEVREGVQMAAKIKAEAVLAGRKVKV